MSTRRFPALGAVRRGALAAASVAAALVLAACGSDDSAGQSGHSGHDMGGSPSVSASASAAQGGHNAQDVAFATDMIPHHRQAVEMADLAPTRAASPDVRALAAEIKQAQDPEIATMSGWLTGWGEKVPSASDMKGMDGMGDHSAHTMPGMMTDADMGKLEKLSGAAFDTAFLQMMIGHHQGAIEMAKAEQTKGSYGPAKQLAAAIVTAQSTEITRMNQMLAQ